jgi:Ca2+/Na+ antiporter
MNVIYLILLGLGLSIIWLGLRTKDEIYRLGAVIGGAIFLVWGFALTPSQFQVLFEAIALIAVFPVCMRCMKE